MGVKVVPFFVVLSKIVKPRTFFSWPWLASVCAGSIFGAEPVNFSREILPILSDKCFHCHGPSETGRKAGLRLDLEEGARRVKEGRSPVVPGNPGASDLVRRIFSTDPEEVMPTPASHRELSLAEKELLRRWIQEGAAWGKHWSFETIRPVKVPSVSAAHTAWAANDVDRFVLARLEREGLQPSPEADRATWLRRVTLDLTGLPATLAEIAAFEADTASDAYPQTVKRLLSLPAYGERAAGEWLDLARYADTYGYQADVERDLSPWRDWVIRAFNQNLPYDRFLEWQIAGDLLPNATSDQVLATAFNRMHRQTNEGGSIEEEWRNEYVSDRVHTFGTAVLGLTLECCRCHDHKYDPISQRDYYSLSGFFNSIDESGLYAHFTQAVPTPTMFLYQEGQESAHRALRESVTNAEARLAGVMQKELNPVPPASELPIPRPVVAYAFDEVAGGRSPNRMGTNAAAEGALELVSGHSGQALRFNGDDAVTLPGVGRFSRTNAFSLSAWLQPGEISRRAVVAHGSKAWTDSGSRGYELVLDQGRPFFGLIHFWPGNAIAIRAQDALPTNVWTHLAVTYDGSSRASGLRIYVNGRPAAAEVVRDLLTRDIQHRAEWGDGEVGSISLTLGARFRDNGFRHGRLDDFQVFDLALTPGEVRRLIEPTASLTEGERREWALARLDASVAAAWADVERARAAENNFITGVREIMVMRDRPTPRPTFVLKRGVYDAPGDRVEAGAPERLLPFAAEWPRNRLGLAHWVTDRNNPLTARVVVNRVWKQHFGRGLAPTVEDFGMQGRSPSHPELLDWLANRFIESGWDRKALHELIVLSATYRQSSRTSPEAQQKDPDNILLARGPKHRLSAEVIRDRALKVSGLLVPQVGGPSVKPYQPAGVWEEAGTGKTYTQDHGDKLYRRSLYTFWRRTAPPPSMLTFDATSREVCTAKRETTSTPLQALVLLNDPQFLEAARVIAEQTLRAAPSDLDSRVRRTFQQVTGRLPEPREQAVLRRMLEEQMEYFRGTPAAAEKYLSIGEHARDPQLSVTDLAATAVVASAVMNHDEFVMKR
jgi:hypothetical protein